MQRLRLDLSECANAALEAKARAAVVAVPTFAGIRHSKNMVEYACEPARVFSGTSLIGTLISKRKSGCRDLTVLQTDTNRRLGQTLRCSLSMYASSHFERRLRDLDLKAASKEEMIRALAAQNAA